MPQSSRQPTPKSFALMVASDATERDTLCATVADLLPCDQAEDGAEAFAKALSAPPVLVVSEVELPKMDGYALCHALRSDPRTAATLIVLLTAFLTPLDVRRAAEVGAASIHRKSDDPAALRTELQRLITSRPEPSPQRKPQVEQANPQPPLTTVNPLSGRLSNRVPRGWTTTPLVPSPPLKCPFCDRDLIYIGSYLGGVNERQPEQWDRLRCPDGCGRFEYRHRTKALRNA